MKNSSPLRFYYVLRVAYWLSICKYEITLKTVYIWVDLIYFFTIYVDYFFVATTVLNLSTVRALLCTHCFIKHPKREGETCEICRSGFCRISVIFVAAIENFNLHYVVCVNIIQGWFKTPTESEQKVTLKCGTAKISVKLWDFWMEFRWHLFLVIICTGDKNV